MVKNIKSVALIAECLELPTLDGLATYSEGLLQASLQQWWLLQGDKKIGNFWKTQQKLKKSKKKKLLTEIEPLQLAF